MKQYNRVGVIGRFKPLHNGGAVLLEAICEHAEHVVIGLGSSNKYNVRNPFTVEESQAMIAAFLSSRAVPQQRYEFLHVPDFGHIPEFADGQKWREYVKEHFGELDAFISGNPYVSALLKDDYHLVPAVTLVPEEKRIPLSSTLVRMEMAKGTEAWEEMVPAVVRDYLLENNLVERFRREFGLETLAGLAEKGDYAHPETFAAEREHMKEK